jgi:hypothetical protein
MRAEGGVVNVGRGGIGWDRDTARTVRRALEPLAHSAAPVTEHSQEGGHTTWVEARFDAEIAYAEIALVDQRVDVCAAE